VVRDTEIVPRPDPIQCIHRAKDLHRISSPGDDRLTVWLSVRQPTTASIRASASASGAKTGSFAMTVLNNGTPVANSQEQRGTGRLTAKAGGSVKLVPGQQYKISAKATANNKRLDQLEMDVAVGGTCQ
jgi:hypothetical protein